MSHPTCPLALQVVPCQVAQMCREEGDSGGAGRWVAWRCVGCLRSSSPPSLHLLALLHSVVMGSCGLKQVEISRVTPALWGFSLGKERADFETLTTLALFSELW